MLTSFISFPKNKNKSALLLSRMTEDIKTLNILEETPKKNNNDTILSNLCKSSKKLIKNNRRYNSYIELPKFFKHTYPYRPNTSKSVSESSIDFTKNQINNKLKIKKVIKKDTRFFLKLLKIPFVLDKASVNEEIFFDFVDRSDINTNIKKEYNEYIKSHLINKDVNFHVYKLIEIMKRYKIDKNIFFDNKSHTKINKFVTKSNILIKLKISSLKIIFYKYDNKSSKEINKISTINFPFEFISFFYGVNLNDFLKFLISVINFDYSKNIFYLDFIIFIKLYNEYKDNKAFFEEKSFFRKYKDKTEEFFGYYWDVENGKEIENYLMKIFLPKIKIGIKDLDKNFSWKFFYSLEVYKMLHLIKENFNLWDFFVIKFFSDYKIFRNEINRIICNKYNNNGLRLNDISNKQLINFNQISNILKNSNINKLQFFYSRNNTQSISTQQNETFFLEMEIPRIHINYKYNNNTLDKFFDINMKKLLQINKLSKSFNFDDLIKFSMSIVNKKSNKLKLVKKPSFFENNKYRKLKKSATISSSVKQIRSNIKSNSFKLSQFNLGKNDSPKNKKKSGFNKPNEIQEIQKDIKLNLDKYIFNFDEDILKFIRPKEERKNAINNKLKLKRIKTVKVIRDFSGKNNFSKVLVNQMNDEQKKKNNQNLNIEFGKMQLIVTSKDLSYFTYTLKEKENQYLLDNPTYIWREYIENRIDKFKENMNEKYDLF